MTTLAMAMKRHIQTMPHVRTTTGTYTNTKLLSTHAYGDNNKSRFGKNVAFKSIFRMRVLIYCCNDIVYCGVHVLVYVSSVCVYVFVAIAEVTKLNHRI